jgi:hypothetical protein
MSVDFYKITGHHNPEDRTLPTVGVFSHEGFKIFNVPIIHLVSVVISSVRQSCFYILYFMVGCNDGNLGYIPKTPTPSISNRNMGRVEACSHNDDGQLQI